MGLFDDHFVINKFARDIVLVKFIPFSVCVFCVVQSVYVLKPRSLILGVIMTEQNVNKLLTKNQKVQYMWMKHKSDGPCQWPEILS